MEFADFILIHDGDDPSRLVLSRNRWPEVDVALAATTIEVRRKLRSKLPSWHSVPGLVYPLRLSGEQCSSEATAMYKAGVCFKAGDGADAIADLTGGLGADAWAFSKLFGKVLYNEADEALVNAARRNFPLLGMDNVLIRHARLVHKGGDGMTVSEILDGFSPGVVFLDPARRGVGGRKVFLLEDCSPDITALTDELFEAVPVVVVKLSPMADISMLLHRLPCVSEIHCVAAEGECKELLVVMKRGFDGEPLIVAADSGSGACLNFTLADEDEADLVPVLGMGGIKGFLFEPGKALTKAGAFKILCSRFPGLKKIGVSTHLYVTETVPDGLSALGKVFRIVEVLPMNGGSLRDIAKRYPRAEVTARNMQIGSDRLREKLKCLSGSDIHIFACRTDYPGGSGNVLIITEKNYNND